VTPGDIVVVVDNQQEYDDHAMLYVNCGSGMSPDRARAEVDEAVARIHSDPIRRDTLAYWQNFRNATVAFVFHFIEGDVDIPWCGETMTLEELL
jgi:hypothetical protein